MQAPLIVIVRKATPEFPRHSEPAITERRDGSLFMIWQEYMAGGNGGEDNAPSRLSSLRSCDGGRTWIDPRILVQRDPGDVNVYSPNLLVLPGGEWLFIYFHYRVLASGQPPSTSAYLRRSPDEGATFGAPECLWDRQPLGFASGVVKRHSSGRIVLPIGRQTGAIWSPTDHEVLGCMLSDDDGRTWHASSGWIDLPLRGAMESHVEELRDGRLMMVMRTQLGAVFFSLSSDAGDTWSKPQTTGLRSPESCPELVRIPSTGDLLLTWNDSEYDPAFGSHYGKRSPLSLALSRDDGRSWTRVGNVETDPVRGFSNPVCHVSRRGQVTLMYWTCRYHVDRWLMDVSLLDLRAALFDVEWIYSRCPSDRS